MKDKHNTADKNQKKRLKALKKKDEKSAKRRDKIVKDSAKGKGKKPKKMSKEQEGERVLSLLEADAVMRGTPFVPARPSMAALKRGYESAEELRPASCKGKGSVKDEGPMRSREAVIVLPDIEIKAPKGCSLSRKEVHGLFMEEVTGALEKLRERLSRYTLESQKNGVQHVKARIKGKPLADIYIALLFAFFVSAFCGAQEVPNLPGNAGVYARQFLAYQDQCNAEAQTKINAARAKLAEFLTAEANKASVPGDAVAIRGYLASVQADAREAAAPTCFSYWTQGRVIAGYYNNNPLASVTVDVIGKKRVLTITGNQDTAKTVGEVFLVRDGRETKLGDWKTGQANPLTFDVSKQVTKAGTYTFKFRYKDGGDEFTGDKVGIEITK